MERNVAVDVLKGLGIFTVVLGHYSIPSWLYNFIFSFHMPLFFILSGYFYKPKDNLHVVKQGWRKLLIPYLFVGVVSILLSGVKGLGHDEGLSGFLWGFEATLWGSGSHYSKALFADLPVIGAVWFLLALFFCKTVYNGLCNAMGDKYQYAAISVSVLATVACQYVYMPLSLLPGLSAMLFYWLGQKFREYETQIPNGGGWLIVYLVIWITISAYCKMSMVRCFYSCLPLNVIGALCAFLVLYYAVAPWVQKLPVLCGACVYMGKYSLVILCFHLLELNYFPYSKLSDTLFTGALQPYAFWLIFLVKMSVILLMVELSRRVYVTRYIFSISRKHE